MPLASTLDSDESWVFRSQKSETLAKLGAAGLLPLRIRQRAAETKLMVGGLQAASTAPVASRDTSADPRGP